MTQVIMLENGYPHVINVLVQMNNGNIISKGLHELVFCCVTLFFSSCCFSSPCSSSFHHFCLMQFDEWKVSSLRFVPHSFLFYVSICSTLVSVLCLTSYFLPISCLPVTCQTVLQVQLLCDVTLCQLVNICRLLREAQHLHLQCWPKLFSTWLNVTSQKCQEYVEQYLFSPICLHGMQRDKFCL